MALIPVADIGPDPRDDVLVVGQQRYSGVVAMHAHIKTTQRFAHLSDKTLISAVNTAGSLMPGAVAQPLAPS